MSVGQQDKYNNKANTKTKNYKVTTPHTKRKAGNNMTLHQNAKFTCEILVQDYIDNNKCTIFPFWDVMKIIKHSYEINAINMDTAERYCYHMHITFDEMMTADDQ